MNTAIPASQDFPRHNTAQYNLPIFNIYNIYRLVISLILLISFLIETSNSVLGSYDSDMFIQVASVYVILNLAVFLFGVTPWRKRLHSAHYVSVIIVDILILVTLSYTCGGVSSGMAHLLIVPIAAGSMLSPGRISIFLAAVGSIAAIYSEIYLFLRVNEDNEYYVQAGILGLTLFVTALVIHSLSGRIRRNELLAEEQRAKIRSLQEMNFQIIQRMQAGIIVVDTEGRILNANTSAQKLVLGNNESYEDSTLPPILHNYLDNWKINPHVRIRPFSLPDSDTQVQASFSFLTPGSPSNILIFLEDYSLLSSRVQELKLVSLGRLTASIAHEIRNPLGAISHAGQLLTESSSHTDADDRLVEIIVNHSDRINSIIENILQLSRKRDDIPELIDLENWLQQFVERFSSTYNHPVNIDLKIIEKNLQIRVNPSQLEQLMTNLCDNGLRYSTRKTGSPHLTIHGFLAQDGSSPCLDIIDDGNGIASEDSGKIFEPFFTTESEGTGLGLYICREICEANQAKISYLFTENHKSCFRVIFTHPDRQIA